MGDYKRIFSNFMFYRYLEIMHDVFFTDSEQVVGVCH